MVGRQRGTDGHPQRLTPFGTTDLEVEVGHPVHGTVDAEHLAKRAELEDCEAARARAETDLIIAVSSCAGSVIALVLANMFAR